MFLLFAIALLSTLSNADDPTTSDTHCWVQVGEDIDGEDTEDYSGGAVSLSADGSILAIGATGNKGVSSVYGDDYEGHVRVYENKDNSWVQVGGDIDGEISMDYFGEQVSMNNAGNIISIGGPRHKGDEVGYFAGHVQSFQYDQGDWVQLGEDIDGDYGYDFSGRAVSMSGTGSRIAIGAPSNDGNGGDYEDTGHVRVYENKDGIWVQMGADIDGEDEQDKSGWAVSLSFDGNRVAIGAPVNRGESGDSQHRSGHVRVYEFQSDTWVQLGEDIDGEAAGDSSGYSISMNADGSILAIGAPDNTGENGDRFKGHVRVYSYDLQSKSWAQKGADIDGFAAGDGFGVSVSLNVDGSILAIGAPNNDGNGEDSGHVRVYRFENASWAQMGADIDGEAADDASGTSISMSDDGSILAIGAIANKGVNGVRSGHVRVYEWKLADCVLGAAVSASDCTTSCGTVTQSITTPATECGNCVPGVYACQPGDGSCPADFDFEELAGHHCRGKSSHKLSHKNRDGADEATFLQACKDECAGEDECTAINHTKVHCVIRKGIVRHKVLANRSCYEKKMSDSLKAEACAAAKLANVCDKGGNTCSTDLASDAVLAAKVCPFFDQIGLRWKTFCGSDCIATSYSYDEEKKTRCYGSDEITRKYQRTVEECKEKCTEDDSCKAFYRRKMMCVFHSGSIIKEASTREGVNQEYCYTKIPLLQ